MAFETGSAPQSENWHPRIATTPPASIIAASDGVVLRLARDEDANAIIALITAVWSEYPGKTLVAAADMPELLQPATSYAGCDGRFWVIEANGQIIGTIALQPSAEPGVVELQKLYVARHMRHNGLGEFLCQLVEREARQRGAHAIELWSDVKLLDAHRHYETLGYARGPEIRKRDDTSKTVQYYYRKEFDSNVSTVGGSPPTGDDDLSQRTNRWAILFEAAPRQALHSSRPNADLSFNSLHPSRDAQNEHSRDARRMTIRAQGSRLVAVMCFAEILCMTGFATYPALLPVLRADWGLSNGAAGLIGGILFLGYVAAVPLLTSLTDRVDARRVYMISALVAACGSGLFAAVVSGFFGALIAQLLFGIGFAGVFMPGLKAMSDRIDEKLQSRAVAMYMSLGGFGLAGSYFLAGIISTYLSWRLAFGLATLGPLTAALLVLTLMTPRQPSSDATSPGFLASFGIVFRNRSVLGYTIGYIAHCWEVQGLRAWMVAFLTFAAGSATGATGSLDAPTLASIIALGGIGSSIGCNEFAKKLGRVNLITGIMVAGLLLGIAAGLSWRLSLLAAVVLIALYYAIMMADAGALAAGTVAAAKPEQRGATLGVYSMLGYGAGLVAPTVFGMVLDVAGGAQSGWAWATSFAVLALPNLIAIVILRQLASTPAPRELLPNAATRFASHLGAQRDLAGSNRPGALGR
jgi:MFS family permease/N-acetylglutamate synthase-like GNAT family acetyltransferase